MKNEKFKSINVKDVNVYVMGNSGPEKKALKEIFLNNKIIIVGVPGAFTPTCSQDHLPGFVKFEKEIKDKGFSDIYFIATNDPFVMDKWINNSNNGDIKFISDADHEFCNATGLSLDLSVIGLGIRLSRFAMIIENCQIIKVFDESGGGLSVSKAEKVLSSL